MFKLASLPLLFAAAVVAVPEPLIERGGAVNCQAVNSIITIMKQQAVATPFCSSYLKIPHPTVTTSVTSTPCAVTSTVTVMSTDTVTTTSVSWFSTVTTVYPVVAVSTTSTCALSATVVETPYNNKRGATRCTTSSTSSTTSKTTSTTKCTTTSTTSSTTSTSTTSTTPVSKPPIGVPTCLTKFIQSDVSSACSCLSIPTQTYTSTQTTTLAAATITSTVANTAKTTVTVTTTSTTFTSTYSGTQYYTSTFTVLPPPSSTIAATANPTETFGAYSGLDFSGQDIQNFFCYPGQTPPAPFDGTSCTSFTDCVNECAYYNAKNLGASQNITCGAVVYNAPPDGSSGSCYLKTGVQGCGSSNSQTNTGVLLPLIATDPQ